MIKKLVLLILTLISSHMYAQKSFLALGDSYTIGESVEDSGRWPVQLINKLNAKGYSIDQPLIIAKTGWRTDDLAAAISKAELLPSYDLVGLLIGVNNQYQGKSVESYIPEFKGLLETAIALAGGNKEQVFVVSIPDYGYTPFGLAKKDKITKDLDAYNAANKRIADEFGVKYYNITDISRSDKTDLVASDGLHPSAVQYGMWVDVLMADPEFIKMLK